jgi:cobalt-zinc-cadmium efflux system membrane fusion protein
MTWKMPLAVALVGGGVALATLNPKVNARAKEAWHKLSEAASGKSSASESREPPASEARKPWDGLVAVDDRQREAIGLEAVTVEAQVRPLELVVNGSTSYDPDTQTQIRPKSLGRVDRVHVNLGQHVRKGQPLIDLSSADLAETKTKYLESQSQWERDKAQLKRSKSLFETKPPSISEKEYLDDVNDERKSAQEFQVAKDRLEITYGLTAEQIANIRNEIGTDRQKYTLNAPAEGYVIKRDVVPGNIYDISSVLLVIAPLDQYWVWGNIYPSDASLVKVGQTWKIYCPALDHTVTRTVEVVTPQVDPDSKTIRIRTTIDNLRGTVKDGLLVSGTLEIPPVAGSTSIPRVAMVTGDGANFVFVQKGDKPGRYERREIQVGKEENKRVVVLRGISPGETVVTKGSLILAQLYDEARTSESGTP